MTLKLHLSIDFLHKLYDDVFKINDEVCGMHNQTSNSPELGEKNV